MDILLVILHFLNAIFYLIYLAPNQIISVEANQWQHYSALRSTFFMPPSLKESLLCCEFASVIFITKQKQLIIILIVASLNYFKTNIQNLQIFLFYFYFMFYFQLFPSLCFIKNRFLIQYIMNTASPPELIQFFPTSAPIRLHILDVSLQ